MGLPYPNLGYKLEFSITLKTQLKGSNFADECLMISGVSSHIKAFSKTSTLPLLGGIASSAFSILSSQGHPPRRNIAASILMPAQCLFLLRSTAWSLRQICRREREEPNSAVFGACFALLLTEEAACLCVFRPVLCKGPKCKDL